MFACLETQTWDWTEESGKTMIIEVRTPGVLAYI